MTILLLGATGFVGGAISLKLRKAGIPVVAVLRHGQAHPKAQALVKAGVEVVEATLLYLFCGTYAGVRQR